ncbi:uncharacterized protein [Dysidea avara]|uniref:uncharacterized protein n=1 Tax=Dysidea avara TaxID=196820 RepID=UPI003316C301
MDSIDKTKFPEDLNKPEVKSFLKKYLTPELFNVLKDKKTSRETTLWHCIVSGLVNLDSSTGFYAGDEESYEVFAPLFNPAIEEYHAPYKITDGHKSDMNPDNLKAPNPDPDGKFIRSTRIRVARNLKGYGLSPTITKEERLELEKKVVEVLQSLEGDLAGTYHSLVGMDEETRQKLVADHFLFKKGDRFLEAAGSNRDWPEGRGIYYNHDKTFLVWVNEEDHLRIISMEKGSDIGSVFTRLCRAVNELDSRLGGFQHTDKLGYLASCPTNIGTGMRASVHVKIPHASECAGFKKLLDEYHIQERGIHGEHSVSTGEDIGVYDISNRRRIGLSEVQCIQDMYDGVVKLIEIEKQFTGECFPSIITAPEVKSYLKKYLTPEVFQQLKDLKTSRGTTLSNCIMSGLVNLDSSTGFYAGDEESYEVFAPLFNPSIEEYHAPYKITDGHKSDMNPDNLKAPNPDSEGRFIRSTRIRVARNLKGYGLSPTITKEERLELEKKVVEVLQSLEGDLAGTYHSLVGMDEETRLKLVADHFLFKKGDRFLEAAGSNRDWPEGRGIYYNHDKTFLVWVNEEDHLRIISMEKGSDIGSVFTRLCRAVNELDSRLGGFQHTDKLGYLASCPTNIGTGMRASVHIKIPNASQSAGFKKLLDEYHIQERGIHGEHSVSTGEDIGVYDISNRRRIGLSEVQCIQDMYNGVVKLIVIEKEYIGEAFPAFLAAPGVKSYLKKYLTPEMFEQLKGLKTSRGTTLSNCIMSGLVNIDSSTGFYAGDEESYEVFAPLFNPSIEEYHAPYKITDGHKSDMNPDNLKAPNPDPDGKFIRSTRIRVARNLKGYGLSPTITKEERLELEKKVIEVLQSLEGDLAGTYHSLVGMDEETRQKLVADHFLFKKGDRFLEAAGSNRDWPEGRGIYYNHDKTFLVWVNEEDHLRIISMEKGSDIGSVFSRLCRAVNELDSRLGGFQHTDKLGYLASCPTNIGTGMRASVHIKIPFASTRDGFSKLLDEYHIQERGIHGEHSVSTGEDVGVYDISNRRRIGLSEVQCIQDMYDGVVKLIEIETEYLDQLDGKCFPTVLNAPGVKSFLKKYLTPEMFEQLKGLKTSRGTTLNNCIMSGLVNLDSSTGFYAGDEESYEVFAPLFNPAIEEYHAPYKITDGHKSDMNPDNLKAPNPDPDGKFIRSTRIRVARNLKGYGLSPTITKEERLELEKKVVEVLQSLEGDLAGTYHSLVGMDEETRQKLVVDHFLFKKGDRFLEAAGSNRDWPEGRGIYYNHDKTFLVWVNEEDHLRIISMEKGSDIGSVFTRLCRAVNELDSRLGGFQHTDKLGYLASCPTNIGTGMRASVHIKIPNASESAGFRKLLDDYHIQERGIHGEHSVSTGEDIGVYDISNRRRIGLSEVQCIQDMYDGVVKLIEIEGQYCGLSYPSVLAPPEVKSYLKKYLTPEVFQQLKDLKTSRGTTLSNCIMSGLVNLDSSTGFYAGDEESYEVFAPLFNPAIEEYHAPYKITDGHKSDMNPDNLKAPNPDPNGKFIRSTRIRVARNLKGYGLSPTITKEERLELEKKVVEVLQSLEGDLAGTYHSLVEMDEETRLKLVADHFLFKKGDRFLEAAGSNRDWPEGRGIYYNHNKTFLVWVNEEDHLRIISMEKGSDIGSVFTRLCRAVNELDSRLGGFQHTDKLGYLASCPTNIGTGMRASVHIKIPNASQSAGFKKLLDEYHIQERGIHGEHSVSTGEDIGVYDISNRRRIGLSEVQCIQDMYDGVVKLIEIEMLHSGQVFPSVLAAPEVKSYLKKYLTPELFEQLKDLKTSRGTTLSNCIMSGLVNLDSSTGFYAGDEESYEVFAPLFNPAIEEYHAPYKITGGHKSDMNPGNLKAPNPDPDGKFIRSTRIRVARNLKGYGLSPTITKEERLELEKRVVEVLQSLEGDLAGTYHSLVGMDEETRLKLVADHFLFKKGDRFLEAAGSNRDWPEGRGIYYNHDKTFLVWVNEEDHLRIISMEKGSDIGSVFTRLCRAVNELDSRLGGFQHTDKLGYLASCPTNIGTGMRASVHIKIPNASQSADFKKLLDEYHIQERGIHGEHSVSTGEDIGVYDISNRRRIGLSEVQCIQDMYDGVVKLIEIETGKPAKAAAAAAAKPKPTRSPPAKSRSCVIL